VRAVVLLSASLALGVAACGGTNTKGSWACSGEPGVSCAPISVIDRAVSAGSADSSASPGIESAGPVRWWAPEPFVFSSGQAVRREGDQVLRVVVAPWVDAQGDLHQRSEVLAVMRRGGWYMPAPTTAEASARLASVGRSAAGN